MEGTFFAIQWTNVRLSMDARHYDRIGINIWAYDAISYQRNLRSQEQASCGSSLTILIVLVKSR